MTSCVLASFCRCFHTTHRPGTMVSRPVCVCGVPTRVPLAYKGAASFLVAGPEPRAWSVASALARGLR